MKIELHGELVEVTSHQKLTAAGARKIDAAASNVVALVDGHQNAEEARIVFSSPSELLKMARMRERERERRGWRKF